MSEEARRYLVAYDSPSDQRRERLAHTLERFGDRVQYSVFVVDVRPAKLVRLRTELEVLIDRSQDSVLVADLGVFGAVGRRFEFLGRRADPMTRGPVVI